MNASVAHKARKYQHHAMFILCLLALLLGCSVDDLEISIRKDNSQNAEAEANANSKSPALHSVQAAPQIVIFKSADESEPSNFKTAIFEELDSDARSVASRIETVNFSSSPAYCIKYINGSIARSSQSVWRENGKKLINKVLAGFSTASNQNAASLLAAFNNTSLGIPQRVSAYNRYVVVAGKQPKLNAGDAIFLNAALYGNCLGLAANFLQDELEPRLAEQLQKALLQMLAFGNAARQILFTEATYNAQKSSNWNAVLNAGFGYVGLVLAKQHSECNNFLIPFRKRMAATKAALAKESLCLAERNLPYYWKTFLENGAYREGPLYFNYGMEPLVWFLISAASKKYKATYSTSLLKSAYNFNLGLYNPFSKFWNGPVTQYTNPSYHSFADTDPDLAPSSFLAMATGLLTSQNKLVAYGSQIITRRQAFRINDAASFKRFAVSAADAFSPLLVMLQTPEDVNILGDSTDIGFESRYFTTTDRAFDYAQMLSSSQNAPWVINIKGGKGIDVHAHADSGSFVMDFGARRLFSDLGFERLNGKYPSDYFASVKEQQYKGGWSYYRKNDISHNFLRFLKGPINPLGAAKLVSNTQTPQPGGGFKQLSIWNLTEVYTPYTSSSSRNFTINDSPANAYAEVLESHYFSQEQIVRLDAQVAIWSGLICKDITDTSDPSIHVAGNKTNLNFSRDNVNESFEIEQLGDAVAQVLTANPNTATTEYKKTTATVQENANAGCFQLSYRIRKQDLKPAPGNKLKLIFGIRIRKH